jgi:four helix bundle protein
VREERIISHQRGGIGVASYRDLLVWQRAMVLAEAIYGVTASFPSREMYGLTAQLRRAAVSIPSNIAEGHATRRTGLFLRHLAIAKGSLAEVETQLELACRLGFMKADGGLIANADELGRMLSGLILKLQSRDR